MEGGSVTMDGSTIANCVVTHLGERFGGETAASGILLRTTDLPVRLAATNLSLILSPYACGVQLFRSDDSNVQIRALRIQQPAACVDAPLEALLVDVPMLQCNSSYFTEASGTVVPMCGPGAKCTDEPVADTLLAVTSPHCQCAESTYLPAGLDAHEHRLAPYNNTLGCLEPVNATALMSTATGNLTLSLAKDYTSAPSQLVNLTLNLSGTDWLDGSEYTWAVLDSTPSTWLNVTLASGSVTAPRDSVGATANVPFKVQSSGLQDGSLSDATISVVFSPHASVPNHALPVRTLNMSIRVHVSAVAVASTSFFEVDNARANHSEQNEFHLIACDIDRARLQHGEVERFRAFLTHVQTGNVVNASISYIFNGTYIAAAKPTLLGPHELTATLEEEDGPHNLSSRLMVQVVCPDRQVQTSEHICGCAPGFEPPACTPCPSGTYFKENTTLSGQCEPCPSTVNCDSIGIRLMDLNLTRGYWRLSSSTTDIHRCLPTEDGSSAICVGGSAAGAYCVAGFGGPVRIRSRK